ncbi:MAG: hypothetical protein AB4060_03105 [Crocosphaera sp.]
MNSEQLLLSKWRNLTPDKQQEVIDFVDFLEFRLTEKASKQEVIHQDKASQSVLGEKLRKIRSSIEHEGIPLWSAEQVELEKAERRGGYQEN